MKPRDIDHLYSLGRPSLSPDGSTVLVGMRSPRVAQNDYASRIWLLHTDGSKPPRQFTHGDRDSEPAYSPDGRWVAFVRPDSRGRPQLHLMRADGGDAWRLTDHPLGVVAPVWSPTSTQIAYVAVVPDPGRYGTDPAVPPHQEPPRLITKPFYRADGLGYTVDRRLKLHVLDLPSEGMPAASPRLLLDDRYSEDAPAWNSDGTLLTFTGARHPNTGWQTGTDVHVCAPDGSGLRTLTDASVSAGRPTFNDDDTAVLFVAVALREDRSRWQEHNFGIWRIPVDADGKSPERVTAEGTVDIPPPITANPLGVCLLGDELVFTTAQRGVALLVSRNSDGAVRALLEPAYSVGGYGTGTVEGTPAVAVCASTATSPGEVILLVDGKVRVLTDFSHALRERVDVREPEEVVATAPDGYPVHGWVVKPDGPGPHPVVLQIHGGPHWHHSPTVFDEAQVYAAAGYAVAMCNPRGSMGYGPAHSEAIDDAQGTVDADDLLAFAEHVASMPGMDPDRLGVMGGSYGGSMTTLLVGKTDRFTAAISERAVNDKAIHMATSDLGWATAASSLEQEPGRVAEQSPIAYVDQITAPTLIVHSENDLRCPFEQAQLLYSALLVRDVPTALLIFPGENHNLTRSGQPRHRVQRFEHVLQWWARYLPTERNLLRDDNPYAAHSSRTNPEVNR